MKRKVFFVLVLFFVLFVLQTHTVLAQNSMQLNFMVSAIVGDIDGLRGNFGGGDIRNHVLGAGLQFEPGLLTIMILLSNGSAITFQFDDSSQKSGGGWDLRGGTRVDSYGYSSGRYSGELSPNEFMRSQGIRDAYQLVINDSQEKRVITAMLIGY
jgi:hypothetical protein